MTSLEQSNKRELLSFKNIFTTYYARVVYFAFQILGDREEAEDVAQDTFVNFWNAKENVSSNENAVKAYLYLTAKNLCLNIIRHHNIVREYQSKNQPSAFDDTDVVNAMISSEISSKIYQAIGTLPEQCQEIARMAYIQGMKNQEIADKFQISVNSVRAQKQRAIQLLRGKLNKKDLLLMIFFENI